nr:MAG TPA: hypothetical protein [Caudoviricetes sp.]
MVEVILKIITSKWASRFILAISLFANIILFSNLYQSNKELDIVKKRNETLEAGLIEYKAKDSIRESEIANWQRLTNEKQKILNEETAKRIEVENKLVKVTKDRWESKKFTGECKNDIGLLRDHALKLKENRHD